MAPPIQLAAVQMPSMQLTDERERQRNEYLAQFTDLARRDRLPEVREAADNTTFEEWARPVVRALEDRGQASIRRSIVRPLCRAMVVAGLNAPGGDDPEALPAVFESCHNYLRLAFDGPDNCDVEFRAPTPDEATLAALLGEFASIVEEARTAGYPRPKDFEGLMFVDFASLLTAGAPFRKRRSAPKSEPLVDGANPQASRISTKVREKWGGKVFIDRGFTAVASYFLSSTAKLGANPLQQLLIINILDDRNRAPSQDQLAAAVGRSQRQVRAALADLEKRGLVRRIHRPKRSRTWPPYSSNRYDLDPLFEKLEALYLAEIEEEANHVD